MMFLLEAESFLYTAAATARRHGLTIVTGNEKDFHREGLKVFNPFRHIPPFEPRSLGS
jgi:hypothetical protein